MLTLYHYYRSSASYRVRIALNLKKLTYEEVHIHLVNNGGEQHSPEYLAINPQKLVPTLKDNDKIITQSLAIIEYLNEVFPQPNLLPDDPYLKAQVRAFALSICADLHPLNNLGVLNFLTQELKVSEKEKNHWYQHWVAKGLTALEKKLSMQKSNHKFCFGDTPSLADICLIPQMYNARRFSCDLSSYPRLVKIDEYCQTLSPFIKAAPEEFVSE